MRADRKGQIALLPSAHLPQTVQRIHLGKETFTPGINFPGKPGFLAVPTAAADRKSVV